MHTTMPVPDATSFDALDLAQPLRRAIQDRGYTSPSPIQAKAIPLVLSGRDLLGCAQTGTGKTAAFALPILERLAREPRTHQPRKARVLVLAPTRELAVQIFDGFRAYGRHTGLTYASVFGGVSQVPQVRALAHGVDVLVATPGRLLDLINQRQADVRAIEMLVLDEADRMLDMGFLPDVRRILKDIPAARQTMFFSATMPEPIVALSRSILRDPARITIPSQTPTADRIEQSVDFVARADKPDRLLQILAARQGLTLVFTKTKHGANRIARHLDRAGVSADAIHGNKTQGARQRALDNFRSGRARVLVATDIAARGIDVSGIALVVNFDIPNDPDSYVHRIGRTARAGASGLAIAMCDRDERGFLRAIERHVKTSIKPLDLPANAPKPSAQQPAASTPRPTAENRDKGQRTQPSQPSANPRKKHRRGPGRNAGAAPGPRARGWVDFLRMR